MSVWFAEVGLRGLVTPQARHNQILQSLIRTHTWTWWCFQVTVFIHIDTQLIGWWILPVCVCLLACGSSPRIPAMLPRQLDVRRPPKIPFSPVRALFQSQHASVAGATQRKAYSFNWQTSNGSPFSASQLVRLGCTVASQESPLTCDDVTVHARDRRTGWGWARRSPRLPHSTGDFPVTIIV